MLKSKKLLKFNKISHGFFGRKGGYSKGIYKSLNCGIGSKDNKKNIKKNLNAICKKIKCNKNNLVLMNQTHSSDVKFINSHKNFNSNKIKCDALITNLRGKCLGVLTADCAPVLVYDNDLKMIGVVHAGWKGAYKGIIKKVLSFFKKKGSNFKNINIVIGPCISKDNYEIKEDFKKKFIQKDPKNSEFFYRKKTKTYFSLNNYVKDQISKLGVKNIEIINKDTYKSKNNFFSARKSLKNKVNDYGRNISVIMIN
ncbi:MAG: hypothetical protein CBE35_02040 [Candidatus Pelagibacter sp. TMED275]|nr:MAG: hypothetical protein CBE35_02040 [Candidatus Pelagibacter sp. TMED275]|tara:strand:+ start:227 stop:988 length:762 start_codon:yes stop_codon:yes gene_type:complete